MKKNPSGLLGLCLLTVFALCMLMTLLASARVYQTISHRQQEQFSGRTALGYLSTRIHTADTAGDIQITSLSGVEALLIEEGDYVTYIYCHGGSLKELYCPAGEAFGPEAGENLMPLRSLSFKVIAPDLLALELQTETGSYRQHLRVLGLGVSA